MGVELRLVSEDQRLAVADVAARAFFDEEFMHGKLGPDPVRRLAGAFATYRAKPWDHEAVVFGAYAGDVLVGIVRLSLPGHCTVCAEIDPDDVPADELLRQDWEFEVGVLETHRTLGPHAWISRMAVDPLVQGQGIGSALLTRAVEELRARGGGHVVLEALASRETYYLRHGFTRIGEVPDPWADTSYLLAMVVSPGHVPYTPTA